MAVLSRHWQPLRRACNRACQSATRHMNISRQPQVCGDFPTASHRAALYMQQTVRASAEQTYHRQTPMVSNLAQLPKLINASLCASRASWWDNIAGLCAGPGETDPERMLWHAGVALGGSRPRIAVIFCSTSQSNGRPSSRPATAMLMSISMTCSSMTLTQSSQMCRHQ